jgi:hypothetical protein
MLAANVSSVPRAQAQNNPDAVRILKAMSDIASQQNLRYPPQLSFIPMSPGIPPGNSTTCIVNLLAMGL